MRIQIATFDDYQELCRMIDRKKFEKENKALQTARRLAEAEYKKGNEEVAVMILRIASDLFIMKKYGQSL